MGGKYHENKLFLCYIYSIEFRASLDKFPRILTLTKKMLKPACKTSVATLHQKLNLKCLPKITHLLWSEPFEPPDLLPQQRSHCFFISQGKDGIKVKVTFSKVPDCSKEDKLIADGSTEGQYAGNIFETRTVCDWFLGTLPLESSGSQVKLLFHGVKGGNLNGIQVLYAAL